MDKTFELQKLIDNNSYVKIKKGVYEIAPLFLHSDMVLEIEEGAILKGTIDEEKYHNIKTRVAGIEMDWYPALINAIDCSNVTIKGRGIIDGNGSYWYLKYWGKDMKGGMRKIYDSKGIRFLCDYDCKRPRNVLIQNCSNIKINDITSKDSGFWNIHILYSNDVIIDNIKIDSDCSYAPSTDGIDIDSSYDVTIKNIIASTNDDSIAIKSGRDLDGIKINKPSYNIEIKDSIIRKGFGITLGSELSAGIYNINIHDIKYINTDCAFRIKSSNMRKGYVKNINVSDLECINVKYLFHINLNWNPNYNKCVIPAEYDGEIKEYYHKLLETDNSLSDTIIDDIHISNVNSKIDEKYDGINRIFHLEGLDSSHIRNIYFDNINANALEYGFIKNVDNIVINNSNIKTKTDIIIENNDYDNR